MRVKVLSWLLHHANRETRDPAFYQIKDRILSRYGRVVGYDVQHIEGKKCWSCNGTGIYHKYDQYGILNTEWCWHCTNGWYRRPTWVLLNRLQLGSYVFHKPIQRLFGEKNPFAQTKITIDGYVDHTPTNHGPMALSILFLLYDFVGFQKYFKTHIAVWRLYWYWPRNLFRSISHLIVYRSEARPIRQFIQKIRSCREAHQYTSVSDHTGTELPF